MRVTYELILAIFAAPDYNGIAVVIGAVVAGIASLVNTFLQWRQRKTHDQDKKEAIEARTAQTSKIDEVHTIVSTVAPALITAEHAVAKDTEVKPPAPVVDADKAGDA